MADKDIADTWKEAEKLLDKGKYEEALSVLRQVDADGKEATTLRLAGKAMHLKAGKTGSSSDYRKSASLYRDSVKINPRDKQANAQYNQLLNEMQDKRISQTIFPRLVNEGTPTPAGLFAVVATLLLLLATIQLFQSSEGLEDGEAVMRVTWTDSNGVFHDETITIALHRAEAPIHVENFILHAEDGNYNNVIFHRVIGDNPNTIENDPFMIQGGDFVNQAGTGGYAAKWYGYCNGQAQDSADGCAQSSWTIPDEADNGLKHNPGKLAMAKTNAPHTGGSQFYIVPTDSTPSHLDGVHTVFGTVTDGLEHVNAIAEVPTGQNDRPINDVTIVSIEITNDGIVSVTPWYQFW